MLNSECIHKYKVFAKLGTPKYNHIVFYIPSLFVTLTTIKSSENKQSSDVFIKVIFMKTVVVSLQFWAKYMKQTKGISRIEQNQKCLISFL